MSAMPERIRLEIESATLYRLLAEGVLCAADFRCLDCESKNCVWRLCLMSCKEKMNPGGCRNCGGCPNSNRKPGKEESTPVRFKPMTRKEKQHAE
jgi:hypothetical protein